MSNRTTNLSPVKTVAGENANERERAAERRYSK